MKGMVENCVRAVTLYLNLIASLSIYVDLGSMQGSRPKPLLKKS